MGIKSRRTKNLMTNDYAVTGIYRSGTTLYYNILFKLLESVTNKKAIDISTGVQIDNIRVHKYHEQCVNLNLQQYKSIYSYRDILDCLSSFIIRDKSTFEDFKIHGHSSIEFVNWMISIDESMQNRDGYAEICYEHSINNIEDLIDNIASYYEIDIPESFDKSQFKIENVKKITDSREKVSRIDNYHPRHVHNGEIGRWKTYFTESQKELIFSKTNYTDWKYNRYKDFGLAL